MPAKVDKLSNAEFQRCKVVMAGDKRGGWYVLSPQKANISWLGERTVFDKIEIMKCEIGRKLKIRCYAGGTPVCTIVSESVINSISIDR